jgi:hypothetical protein
MCKELVFTKSFTVEICSREEWDSPRGPYWDKETLEERSGYLKTGLYACLSQFGTTVHSF